MFIKIRLAVLPQPASTKMKNEVYFNEQVL